MAAAVDALYRPLGGWLKRRTFHFAIGAAPVAALWAVAIGGVALWVVTMKDPLGGEPIVRLRLPTPAEVLTHKSEHGEAKEAEKPAEAKHEPAADESSQIKIITPGGSNGQGQVKIIDLGATSSSRGLKAAPEPRLVEKSRHGLLPKIGADGTKPSAFYARPFNPAASNRSSDAPRIAILVGGLGLSAVSTSDAIAKLPPEMTLAFAPYGANLQAQVNKARGDGHEVMLQMPMEPFDFPANDPGPQTLLTTLPPDQNLDRLHWAMTRFSGFTGLTNYMGAKFLTSEEGLKALFNELNRRGLTYVEDGTAARSRAADVARGSNIGFGRGSITLDTVPTQQRIDEALAALEAEAEQKGSAIGIASALPVTIDRLARWAKAVERKGFVLVPVSATVSGRN